MCERLKILSCRRCGRNVGEFENVLNLLFRRLKPVYSNKCLLKEKHKLLQNVSRQETEFWPLMYSSGYALKHEILAIFMLS